MGAQTDPAIPPERFDRNPPLMARGKTVPLADGSYPFRSYS